MTIYIKGKEKVVINYDSKENLAVSLGDEIIVTGTLKHPSNNTIPNLFNYRKYLYNNDIYYTMNAKSIKKVSNNTNIIYDLREKLAARIEKIDKAKEYINTFILGDTSKLGPQATESYRYNGISHLFSISGMHISLFASIILCILKRISYNNYYNYGMVITFLFIYTLLVGSTPSVIRSLIMYILFSLNKLLNLKIKKIDIMHLVLIIMLLINPYYIYNIAFQYSYVISYTLVVFSYKLKKMKSSLVKSLSISFIAFLASFPICIYNFYQANPLSIFFNLVAIPLVNIFIFPLSIMSMIIPKMSYVLFPFTTILEKISIFLYNLNIGPIIFSKPSLILIIIYYLFIYLFLYNPKIIIVFLIMLTHLFSNYLDSKMKVTIIDVGQGDSMLLKLPYNQGNILIDTGGLRNNDYSLAKNKIIPYVKSLGINHLDYLILTHGDFDHMGESINLINNFKVDKVIFNNDEYNDLEQELIKALEKKKIKYYKGIKKLNISKYKFYFLNTKEYDNENDNSNVIYFNYDNYKFLFMGDAGTTKEKDILNKYNIEDIDFLKVGHHGSDTSSSKEFINEINPKCSLISVGKNNRYGHPKDSVLDILSNSKIYRTDLDGSIEIKLNKNGYKIGTYSP